MLGRAKNIITKLAAIQPIAARVKVRGAPLAKPARSSAIPGTSPTNMAPAALRRRGRIQATLPG